MSLLEKNFPFWVSVLGYVPLCATDHRSLHDFGAEKGWWEKKRVNPSKEAERLWMQSRGLRKSA